MKLAVMQPYFFPYIGYFQLIAAVDKFVFYDDVNYIKQGWINRNRILLNGEAHYITLTLNKGTPNKLIKEIEIIDNRPQILTKIELAYKKAPYFKSIWPLINKCLAIDTLNLSKIAINSVIEVSKYLELDCKFEVSSCKYSNSKGIGRQERLLTICKISGCNQYINLFGGQELYSQRVFTENMISLKFITPEIIQYYQFNNDFIPSLSIIDVLMFNSKQQTRNMLVGLF